MQDQPIQASATDRTLAVGSLRGGAQLAGGAFSGIFLCFGDDCD